ncbi:MAG: hypothetical protein ACYDIA_26015 [Candidatus Humimicrobiaceae bacterium]
MGWKIEQQIDTLEGFPLRCEIIPKAQELGEKCSSTCQMSQLRTSPMTHLKEITSAGRFLISFGFEDRLTKYISPLFG